jgi:hypothetical protein
VERIIRDRRIRGRSIAKGESMPSYFSLARRFAVSLAPSWIVGRNPRIARTRADIFKRDTRLCGTPKTSCVCREPVYRPDLRGSHTLLKYIQRECVCPARVSDYPDSRVLPFERGRRLKESRRNQAIPYAEAIWRRIFLPIAIELCDAAAANSQRGIYRDGKQARHA